jgi:hypothetical protein
VAAVLGAFILWLEKRFPWEQQLGAHYDGALATESTDVPEEQKASA